MKKQLYVEKEGGKWKVSESGSRNSAPRVFSTKAEAVTDARAQAGAQRVVIRNATGQIIRTTQSAKSLSDETVRFAVLNAVQSRTNAGERANGRTSVGERAVQGRARKSAVTR